MIFPQSILVYVHVRVFSNFFFYHFWGTNQWFCDFLTVIIVIISLLMGRGDIVRNIWLSFPFPTLPFNLPYTDVILTLKPPGIPLLLRPSPFPNNRGLGSSKFLNYTHWSFSDYDLFQIKRGSVVRSAGTSGGPSKKKKHPLPARSNAASSLEESRQRYKVSTFGSSGLRTNSGLCRGLKSLH